MVSWDFFISSQVQLGKESRQQFISTCVFSGGRTIVVTGTGFDLIQNAAMKVLPLADELLPNITPEMTSRTAVSAGCLAACRDNSNRAKK